MVTPFRGDVGSVRKVISNLGMNYNTLSYNTLIFNDKRKNFRRIKIWSAKPEMNTKSFYNAIKEEFGDRFITSNILEGSTRNSYVIFLKN